MPQDVVPAKKVREKPRIKGCTSEIGHAHAASLNSPSDLRCTQKQLLQLVIFPSRNMDMRDRAEGLFKILSIWRRSSEQLRELLPHAQVEASDRSNDAPALLRQAKHFGD